jgi:hypothetical protein
MSRVKTVRHKKDRFCGGLDPSFFSNHSSLRAAQDSSGLLENEIRYDQRSIGVFLGLEVDR